MLREVVVPAPVVWSLHVHSVDCVIVARDGHIICTVSVMSEEEVCFPTLTIMSNAEL